MKNDISVEQIMTKELKTIGRNENVLQAKQILYESDFHHLPVLDEQGQLEGIISQTDLNRMQSGLSLFRNRDKDDYENALFETVRVCEVMTKDLTSLRPSDKIQNAYNVFKENRIHALPVIDKGALVGIVTPIDLLEYFFNAE